MIDPAAQTPPEPPSPEATTPPPPASGDREALPVARWIALGALAMVEVLAVTVRFDTASLAGVSASWAVVVGHSHVVMPLGLAMLTSVALLGGGAVRGVLPALRGALSPARLWWPWVLVQIGCAVFFGAITQRLFEGDVSGLGPTTWVAFWLTAAGAAVATWGLAALPARAWWLVTRRCKGALAIGAAVGTLAWLAGQASEEFWAPLGHATLVCVRHLLDLVVEVSPYQPERAVVGVGGFTVRVAAACSGYEGIGLIAVYLGAYLWFFRAHLRFPHALALLPIGIVVVWLANVVRVAALILVGAYLSRGVALGGFHSTAGWILFCAVGLGLVGVARRTHLFASDADPDGADAATPEEPNLTAAYLLPLLCAIATAMLTAALSAGFDALYVARVAVAAAVLGYFWRRIDGLSWRLGWEGPVAGVVVFAMWIALVGGSPDDYASAVVRNGLEGLPAGLAAAWIVVRIAGAAVTVPLVEEIAFRGYLTRRLIATDFQGVPLGTFSWLSFLGSSVLFGALHQGAFVAGTLAGMAYALVVYRTRRLTDAVVAHGLTNALLSARVLATGAYSLW